MKHKLYTRLLSLALAVGLVIGMLPSAAAVDTVGDGAGQPVTLGDSDSGLELSKKLVKNSNGTYGIQLEAYATGEIDVSTEYKAVPTDIVLVLDQSGSMAESFQTSSTSGYQKIDISTNGEAYDYRDNLYYYDGSKYYEVNIRTSGFISTTYSYSWNGQYATSRNNNGAIPSQLKGHLYIPITKQQALKDAVTEFVNSVQAQAQEDGVDHRIAMVGFASDNRSSSYQNTELLVTSSKYEVNYRNIGNSDYQSSLLSVNNNGEVNARLTEAINRIDAEGGTAINLGMKMAQNILNNNPVSSNEERNQVVIVFTDGEPGIFTDDSDNTRTNDYANPAISTAKEIKNKGVKVYSVGIFDGADASVAVDTTTTRWSNVKTTNRFMHYLSSNYPNAQSMSNGGTPDEKKGYYLSAADADTLKDIFQKISDDIQTGGSSSTLDSNAIVRDVLTKELQLPEGTTADDIDIETYQAANGNTVTNPDVEGAWVKDPVNGVTASIGADGRTIDVTGFDFSRNFVADTGRVEGNVSQTGNFYGRKLVITIPVEPNPDFFGGNNIDTNAVGSGVYANAEETTPVDTFVSPNMNIPVNCNVTGNDQSIYITQSADVAKMVKLSAQPDGWNNSHVTITYQVKDGDTVIGTYTIQPGATTGTWSGNSVSPEDCKNYTVTCTITPNEGKSDSVGDAAVTGKEEDVQAAVHVFTPTVTWTDSSKEYGTSLDDTLLDSHEVTVTWADKNTHSVAKPSGNAPTLDYTYVTPTNEELPETLTKETNVKVSAVKIGDTDILANTKFEWQKDNSCPNTCTDPNDAYQFRIHMATSHENEYPVRFYLEGVGSGVRDYPYSDAWAKLNSWLSGGFANVTTSENPMTEFKSLQGETGYDASVSGGSTAGGIAGHANVLTWLEKYNVSPAIDVNDISAVLTELVKMYPEIANASVTSVGGEEYTVNEIIENPHDFQIVYTQVTQNHDQLIEYYKGNGSLAAGQDSYHVHLSIRKNPGDLTITKTFSGVENLPNTFAIEVRDSAGQLIDTLSLNEATESNGTYTWTLENLNEDIYTVTETGMNVEDMSLSATMKVTDEDTTTPETVKETTAKVKVADNKTSTVEIANSYSAADGKLNINKVVTEFANNGKPVFDFKLTSQADGTVYYYHVDMTDTAVNTAKAVTPDGGVTLPVGDYTIEELSNQNYTLKSVEGATANNDATYKVTITPNGTTIVTFTNDPKNTNIPTDGSATENKVLEIKDGVIAWKQEPVQYGNDPNHDNINPDDEPAE